MINIDELIKTALKAKDKDALKAYRNIKTKILEFKTAENAKEYNDKAELELLKKMVKQLNDSASLYTQKDRFDLAEEYAAESAIIRKLLPTPSNEQMLKLGLIDIEGVEFEPNTGNIIIPKKIMGIVIKHMKNQFPYNDSSEIANLVKQYVV